MTQPICIFSGYIAGVPFRKLDWTSNPVMIGDELRLVPEPDNQYDRGAVRIERKFNGFLLGYVPKECTFSIHSAFKQGLSVAGFVRAVDPQTKWKEILVHVYAEESIL